MLDLNKNYVYDGTEIKLTGRKAQRKRTRSRTARTDAIDEIFEIKPADEELGSWKKWVREIELYEVIDDN